MCVVVVDSCLLYVGASVCIVVDGVVCSRLCVIVDGCYMLACVCVLLVVVTCSRLCVTVDGCYMLACVLLLTVVVCWCDVDVFPSADEAEDKAAQNACHELAVCGASHCTLTLSRFTL